MKKKLFALGHDKLMRENYIPLTTEEMMKSFKESNPAYYFYDENDIDEQNPKIPNPKYVIPYYGKPIGFDNLIFSNKIRPYVELIIGNYNRLYEEYQKLKDRK